MKKFEYITGLFFVWNASFAYVIFEKERFSFTFIYALISSIFVFLQWSYLSNKRIKTAKQIKDAFENDNANMKEVNNVAENPNKV